MNDDKECYLEFKHCGRVIRFSNLDNTMSMSELHNLFRLLALAAGYYPENVEEYLPCE